MKRRNFLKTLGIACVSLAVAPTDFLTPQSKPIIGSHWKSMICDDLVGDGVIVDSIEPIRTMVIPELNEKWIMVGTKWDYDDEVLRKCIWGPCEQA